MRKDYIVMTPETFTAYVLSKWQSPLEGWLDREGYHRLSAVSHWGERLLLNPITSMVTTFVVLLSVSYGHTLTDWSQEIKLPGQHLPDKTSSQELQNTIFLTSVIMTIGFIIVPLLQYGIKWGIGRHQQNDAKFTSYMDCVKEIFGEDHPYVTLQPTEHIKNPIEFHLKVYNCLAHGKLHRHDADADAKLSYGRATAYQFANWAVEHLYVPHTVDFIPIQITSPVTRPIATSIHADLDDVSEKVSPQKKSFQRVGSIQHSEKEILLKKLSTDAPLNKTEQTFIADVRKCIDPESTREINMQEIIDFLADEDSWVKLAKVGLVQGGQSPVKVLPQAIHLAEESPDDRSDTSFLSEEFLHSPLPASSSTPLASQEEPAQEMTDPFMLPFVAREQLTSTFVWAKSEGMLEAGPHEVSYEYFDEVSFDDQQKVYSREQAINEGSSNLDCQLSDHPGTTSVILPLYIGNQIRNLDSEEKRAEGLLALLSPILQQLKTAVLPSDQLQSIAIFLAALLKTPEGRCFTNRKFWIAQEPHIQKAFLQLSQELQVQLVYVLLKGPDCAKLTAISLAKALSSPALAKKSRAFCLAFNRVAEPVPEGAFDWRNQIMIAASPRKLPLRVPRGVHGFNTDTETDAFSNPGAYAQVGNDDVDSIDSLYGVPQQLNPSYGTINGDFSRKNSGRGTTNPGFMGLGGRHQDMLHTAGVHHEYATIEGDYDSVRDDEQQPLLLSARPLRNMASLPADVRGTSYVDMSGARRTLSSSYVDMSDARPVVTPDRPPRMVGGISSPFDLVSPSQVRGYGHHAVQTYAFLNQQSTSTRGQPEESLYQRLKRSDSVRQMDGNRRMAQPSYASNSAHLYATLNGNPQRSHSASNGDDTSLVQKKLSFTS